MTDLKILNNSDPGDADRAGGNDWDQMATLVNGWTPIIDTYYTSADFFNYFIYKSGTTYYMRNGLTKAITSNATSVDPLIQSAVTTLLASGYGGIIAFGPGQMNMNAVIDLPTALSGPARRIGFIGTNSGDSRLHGTVLWATSTFPDQRCMFETSGATDGSSKVFNAYWRDLCFAQEPTEVVAGKKVGGIRWEVDAYDFRQIEVNNVRMEYMYQGIHLIGPVVMPRLVNVNFIGAAALPGITYDFCLKLAQNGTYNHTTLGKQPKLGYFEDLHVNMNPGPNFTNAYVIQDGGYNTFMKCHVDAEIYEDSCFLLTGTAHDNIFFHPWVEDTQTHTDARGCFVLDGSDVFDNVVRLGRFTNVGTGSAVYMVALLNGTFRNDIEFAGFWGSPGKVDNVGCGDYNVLRVQQGSWDGVNTPYGLAPIKIVFTGNATENARIRVMDERKGMTNSGTAATITAGATTGVITHNLNLAPANIRLTPTSDTLGKRWWISAKGSTTFTISIDSTAVSNITFDWVADV